MPPRKGKEPKEQVVYAASKAKTPAYKPLRPSKVARPSTSEASNTSLPKPKPAVKKAAPAKASTSTAKRPVTLPDSEEEEDDDIETVEDLTRDVAASEHSDVGIEDDDDDDDDDDEEGLPTLAALKAGTKKRKASAISVNDDSHINTGNATHPKAVDDDPGPPPLPLSPTDGIPGIPQALLLRLLHEGFAKKDTKIDKHALQIVQTYMEVFVREAIARCVAEKKEAAERGEVGEGDVGWLEVEDLEKVGVGMMLDF